MIDFRFCPRDAVRLEQRRHYEKVRPTCPHCGFVDWGNPKPCTSVIVQRAGQILISRRARDPHKGAWDLLGGFVEPGETVETAAVREVREESGLDVRIVAYLGSFPDTYGDDKVPIVNFAYVTEQIGADEPRPSDDVASLHWFGKDELPSPDKWPFAHSILVLKAWAERTDPGLWT